MWVSAVSLAANFRSLRALSGVSVARDCSSTLPRKMRNRKIDSGLMLAQIRGLEVLLKVECEQSETMIVDGKKLEWERCTSRHLFQSQGQSSKYVGKNTWAGLAARFMPAGTMYAECVSAHKQTPEYYVIMPWEMELVNVFSVRNQPGLSQNVGPVYYVTGLRLNFLN
jgi:hypothetical protein